MWFLLCLAFFPTQVRLVLVGLLVLLGVALLAVVEMVWVLVFPLNVVHFLPCLDLSVFLQIAVLFEFELILKLSLKESTCVLLDLVVVLVLPVPRPDPGYSVPPQFDP